jgi:hypothetical protein
MVATESADLTAVVRRRLAAQLLSGSPAHGPEEVAGRILAIQAQDPRGARLAIRARSEGLTAADVDGAFTRDRSIVITWLNRGTLHLVLSEDYPWLLAVTAPRRLSWVAARLRQLGVSAEDTERTIETVTKALSNEGALTRHELRRRVAARGLPVEGQAFIHQIALASLRGLVVRGPMLSLQHAFVLARDWLGEPPRVERDVALGELARRYLAGHGPATEDDLSYWAGISLADARSALRRISSELIENPPGMLDMAGREAPPDLPGPRLLGPFDPLLHGWRSRKLVVGDNEPRIVNGGLFRPMLLVDGRTAGTWSLASGRVELAPFEDLAPGVASAVETDARDVERYLAAGPRRGPPASRLRRL